MAIEAEWREGLGFWEVPVIGRTWSPLRGWTEGGMAGAIPRPDLRAHTLTAYTDVGAVHDALGPAGSGHLAAVLVADGIVRWQAAGPPDRERIARTCGLHSTGSCRTEGPACLRRIDMTKIRVPATLTSEYYQS